MEIKKLVGYGVGGLVSLIVGYDRCPPPCRMVCGPRRCECICPWDPWEKPFITYGKGGEEYSSTKPSSDDSTSPTNLLGTTDEPRLFTSIF